MSGATLVVTTLSSSRAVQLVVVVDATAANQVLGADEVQFPGSLCHAHTDVDCLRCLC